MKQEDLLHGVYMPLDGLPSPLIKRRLGIKPSHVNCGCPGSWTSVIEPLLEDQSGRFAVKAEPQTLNTEEREDLTSQVKRIDGSGGLAPYEDFGVVEGRGDLVRSIAAACMQTGAVILPNGDLQLPLFIMAESMPPLRWEIDEFLNS